MVLTYLLVKPFREEYGRDDEEAEYFDPFLLGSFQPDDAFRDASKFWGRVHRRASAEALEVICTHQHTSLGRKTKILKKFIARSLIAQMLGVCTHLSACFYDRLAPQTIFFKNVECAELLERKRIKFEMVELPYYYICGLREFKRRYRHFSSILQCGKKLI